MLSYFDLIDLFPRHPGGPIPMLIVDGHQSCLDPGFIKYINEPHHKCKVCFVVLYATVIWQVGDASEQNRKFKTEWYRVKADFMTWKYDHLLPLVLGPTNIMPLFNVIFHDSYGNVASNKKAVAGRGWCWVNRKLLEHPSLLDDSTTPTTSDSTLPKAPEASSSNTSNVTLTSKMGTQHQSSTGSLLSGQGPQGQKKRPIKGRERDKVLWITCER